jgi:hypothetical protein
MTDKQEHGFFSMRMGTIYSITDARTTDKTFISYLSADCFDTVQ